MCICATLAKVADKVFAISARDGQAVVASQSFFFRVNDTAEYRWQNLHSYVRMTDLLHEKGNCATKRFYILKIQVFIVEKFLFPGPKNNFGYLDTCMLNVLL